jgi:hypothetical protein
VHERRRQRDPEPGQFLQRIVAALCLLLVPHIPTKAESTRILDEMYATANARLSRGDAAGAAEGFRVVAEATPELPETNAAAALAIALADWQRQDEAVPYMRRALAAEPANPIAAIVAVIADPAHSVLRDDDALYLTPRASERLAAAAELLASPYPGLRTAPLLLVRFARSGETTGDPYFPQRILGFRSLARAVSFAAMFVVDVPASRFAVYDSRIVASMKSAVDALARNQRRLEELRARLRQVQADLVLHGSGDRPSRLAFAERRAAELEASAAEHERRLVLLERMEDANGKAEVIRKERAWINALKRSAAKERRRAEAIRTGRE